MRPRLEQPVVKLVLNDLQHGPATAQDLAESVGITTRNMREYMKLMLAQRMVVITGLERRIGQPGPSVPIYRLRGEK